MSRFLVFSLFFAILLSILTLIEYYEYRTIRRWVRNAFPPERWTFLLRWTWVVLGIGDILVLLQFVLRGTDAYALTIAQYGVSYPAGVFLAIVIFGFLVLLARDLVRLITFWIRHIVRLAKQLNRSGTTSVDGSSTIRLSEARRQFLKLSGSATIGIVVGTPLVSAIASPRDYRITKIPLFFPNLPAGLHGLTIAQLSDVHSGIYMTEDHMMEIVDLTNSLHANLVALTGDHVDNADLQIPSVRNAMKMLKSDYGIYGCLGNHDHFATAAKVSEGLQQVSITMLNNANRTLKINGEQFAVIGIDDAGHGSGNFARLDDAVRGVDPQMFKILLSHRPEFFPRAAEAGMDLTLAGHTHGGQVGVEFWGINLNPAYLFTKYVRGLYLENGKQLYVNVGVGMVGVPIRIVRPEITLITLQRA